MECITYTFIIYALKDSQPESLQYSNDPRLIMKAPNYFLMKKDVMKHLSKVSTTLLDSYTVTILIKLPMIFLKKKWILYELQYIKVRFISKRDA